MTITDHSYPRALAGTFAALSAAQIVEAIRAAADELSVRHAAHGPAQYHLSEIINNCSDLETALGIDTDFAAADAYLPSAGHFGGDA